jgi:hypothetical protein
MHDIAEPFEKAQARSLDGGQTWTVEQPGVDFECREPLKLGRQPHRGADAVFRVCGVYDHGGEYCHRQGGFYLSYDFGRCWRGPFRFEGLDEWPAAAPGRAGVRNTSRTAVLGRHIFLSSCPEGSWGHDRTFCATWNGRTFKLCGVVCDEPGRRAVMPAVAICQGRMFAVLRRRSRDAGCWLEAFASADSGVTWDSCGVLAETGGNNGNPPALICDQAGRLVCAYGDRDRKAILALVSRDGGRSWADPAALRAGGKTDIGYPRLFEDPQSGELVCVYYWADERSWLPQRIEATRFALN